MSKVNAYWVSPASEIYPVPRTHIQFIIDNTGLFDLSKQDILDKYQAYQEKVPFEGKARKNIIVDQLVNGWVRIRFNTKSNNWHINYTGSQTELKNKLEEWLRENNISQDYIKYISL